MTKASTTRIHLARTGQFRDRHGRRAELGEDILNDLAESYNVETYRAPLVLGHPADGAPAYGWVDRLVVDGEGLHGDVSEVAPDLAEAVAAGQYRNVSISYWPKGHANSPAPDAVSLRHVGVLGAQAPAIKGLKPLAFEDDDQVVTVELADNAFGWRVAKDLFRGLRDWMLATAGQDEADKVLPNYLIDNFDHVASDQEDTAPAPAFEDPSKTPATTVEDPMSGTDTKPGKTPGQTPVQGGTTDLAEREADLATREAALKAREDKIAVDEAAARDQAAVSFADGLIKDGKLAPAAKATIVAIHTRLANDGEAISLSDGQSVPPLTAFRNLWDGAKPVIDLSEHSGDDNAKTIDGKDADALTARAKEIQKERPTVDFSEAIRVAEKEAAT